MLDLPDLTQLSHEQKDEIIRILWPLRRTVAQFEARIKQLEGRVALNSKNSSKPPSSDGLNKPSPKSLRVSGQHPSGGQMGHTGATLSQSAEVDEIIVHPSPTHCAVCQLELPQPTIAQSRQVFELPKLGMRVVAHHQMRAICRCGALNLGHWPAEVKTSAQYGSSVKAMAVHLNQFHLVPLARTATLMQDCFGARLSQASIQSFAQEAALALSPVVAQIAQAVQRSRVVNADESGIRIMAKLHWLHCAVTPTLTWLNWHAKRGVQAMQELGVLLGLKGVVVHDGLAGYRYLECVHALCNAHHMRELVYVHEQENEQIWDSWAKDMIDLLMLALKEVELAQAPLSQARQAWFHARWSALLDRGQALNPLVQRTGTKEDIEVGIATRGRVKQSKATNLLNRLSLYRDDVWRFMTDEGVPFTNNLAEQALRMCKVKQKISGCFRTQHGADTFFKIRSYLATMHKQQANLLDCLTSVFNGQPIQPCLD